MESAAAPGPPRPADGQAEPGRHASWIWVTWRARYALFEEVHAARERLLPPDHPDLLDGQAEPGRHAAEAG